MQTQHAQLSPWLLKKDSTEHVLPATASPISPVTLSNAQALCAKCHGSRLRGFSNSKAWDGYEDNDKRRKVFRDRSDGFEMY